MADQKLDNLLNLALDSTEEERKKSGNLNIGYEEQSGNWDIIVKYSGDAEALSGERIRTVPLLGGYAVVNLPEEEIPEFASRPQIEFVEIPKRLYFQVNQALDAACRKAEQNGLVLTMEQRQMLCVQREQTLRNAVRLEVGPGV